MSPDNGDSFEALIPGEGTPEPDAPAPSSGLAWGAIFILLFVALVVVFAIQNTRNVSIDFLWMSGNFSLALVILVTTGITILVTEVVGLIYRRRRRKRL